MSGSLLGHPVIRIMAYSGLFWVPPVLGKYNFEQDNEEDHGNDAGLCSGRCFLVCDLTQQKLERASVSIAGTPILHGLGISFRHMVS